MTDERESAEEAEEAVQAQPMTDARPTEGDLIDLFALLHARWDEQEARRFQGRGGAWQIVPLVSLPEVATPANTSEVTPETARTYTDYRRLPIGSVVLSHTGRYVGWAWQKISGREWWARDSNWLPTMKMPTMLGQTTIVYRANSGRVGRPEKEGPAT